MKFYLRRIRLNNGGYDALGCYWGVGAPLYHYEDFETAMISGEVRAHNRWVAMSKIAHMYPDATFFGIGFGEKDKTNARTSI